MFWKHQAAQVPSSLLPVGSSGVSFSRRRSSGFSPDSLPGLALWLDADDASTLTLSGSVVDEWRDKSGNGRHFTGSGAARPTLVSEIYKGRNAIQFDGVDDTLTLGASGIGRNVGAVTVYVAVKWTTSPTSAEVVFVSSTATSTQARIGVYGALVSQKYGLGGRRVSTDGFGSASSSGSISAGAWAIQASVFDYANSDLFQYIGGTLDGSNTSFQAAGLTDNTDSADTRIGANLGAGNFADIEVSEILVYHAAHDEATRAQVQAYLEREVGELWTPADAGFTSYWLADDIAGTDGDPVSTWPDAVGSNDATAAGSSRPTLRTSAVNGHNAVEFDGVDDGLDLASSIPVDASTGWWAFSVSFRSSGAANCFSLTTSSAAPNYPYGPFLFNDGNYYFADNARFGSFTTGVTGWVVLVAYSGLPTLRIDGSDVAATTGVAAGVNTLDAIGHRLGDSTFSTGLHAVVGIKLGAPDIAFIQKFEGWAAHYYGLTASLPASHPYKLFPPRKKV